MGWLISDGAHRPGYVLILLIPSSLPRLCLEIRVTLLSYCVTYDGIELSTWRCQPVATCCSTMAIASPLPAKVKKQKRVRPLLEPSLQQAAAEDAADPGAAPVDKATEVAAHAGNSKFARALGSVDYQTREKGLQALTRFLTRSTSLSRHDMMKIWKGLFYCFWHSDKSPVQVQTLARQWMQAAA